MYTIFDYKNDANLTLANLKETKNNLIHTSSGIVTEVRELELALINGDDDNITEELGDIMWFAVNTLTVFGADPLNLKSIKKQIN